MKKTYKLPKMLPIFGMMALTAFGVEAAPDITVGTVTGSIGDVVNLPVTFVGDDVVVGMQFDVVIPTGFTYETFASGNPKVVLADDSPLNVLDEEGNKNYSFGKSNQDNNTIRFVVSDQAEPILAIGSGELFSIPVTIGDGATGDNAVALTGVVFSDATAQSVTPTSMVSGSINIGDGGGGDVTLTDVTGKTEADAKADLAALGLNVTTTTASSDTVAAGSVISQDPAAGTVAAGSTVALVISSGPETSTDVTLTDVTGKTEAAAKTELEALGLTVTTTTASSDTVATGSVISQNPAAGTVAAGSAVALVISTGPSASKVTVPSVGVGEKTEAVATAELKALGLNVTVVESFNQTHAAGLVIGQNPAAGTEVSAGSTVTITVSKGPTGGGGTGGDGDPTETVVVTDDDVQAVKDLLVGDTPVTLAQVVQALVAQGFKGVSQLKSIVVVSDLPKGTVIAILGFAAGDVSTSDLTVQVSAGPAGGGAGTAGEPIPTLSFWGLLGLSALMPGIVGWMSKKKKIK